ncbi:MAG TPA: hypothetical protein DCR40_10350 [Prolixibacteraceae bacterium]|nr:hypothetical protein [Prolixibacteraceae bacterium]
MQRINLTAKLYLDEYIPKDLYLKYQDKPHILIGLLDNRLIEADQKLREVFGSVTINNWWNGGQRNWSGLRTPESPDYSPTSQHSFGRASDKLFSVPAEEVRKYIQEHWHELGITCIEDGVSWVHSDVRFCTGNELLIVRP